MSGALARIPGPLEPAPGPVEPADAPLPERARHTLTVLRSALADLHDDLLALDDPELVAWGRLFLAKIRADANLAISDIDGRLHELIPVEWTTAKNGRRVRKQERLVDGLGLVECKQASTDTWDADACWRVVAELALADITDPDTGERPPAEEIVEATIARARALRSEGPWRKTALRAAGHDEKDEQLCDQTWGAKTVQITGPEGGAK